MTPDELKKFLAFGDALVATPSLWRYIIAQGVIAPDNAMAVSFGETLTPELSADIRKAGFGAQREFYGSTETGLIGWRDAPGEPFALFDQWKRDGDILRRTTPSGEVVTFEPMDTLVWDGDRRFRLGGRRDGAVQIGAVNVFPAQIAEKISEHPLVGACVVTVSQTFGRRRPACRDDPAEVGRRPGESAARAIDNWCRSRLRPYERPRVYNFTDEIAQ